MVRMSKCADQDIAIGISCCLFLIMGSSGSTMEVMPEPLGVIAPI